MKRLTETLLFQQLYPETINLTEVTLKPMYDDFVRSVIDLCVRQNKDVPAYFTLHYTLSEINDLKLNSATKVEEKKLHYPCRLSAKMS